jgi:hypothetical protein
MSSVYVDELLIEAAQLGDDAGLCGGFALCQNPLLHLRRRRVIAHGPVSVCRTHCVRR